MTTPSNAIALSASSRLRRPASPPKGRSSHKLIPGTSERVPKHTSDEANGDIRLLTEARVARLSRHPQEIDRRLDELEREWDIERTLEVNGSLLAMAGLALGVTRDVRWLLLPAAVVTFCLQHALQGWCPPLSIFRRLGIRTQREIDEERYALKALRGDFARSRKPHANGEAVLAVDLLERVRR
jgi:hypothetical protein